MTTVMTTLKQWEDQYLAVMARMEEPILRFTGKTVEAVADYIPERPQWSFLDEVPTMTELVDSQLKFRRRMVDEQAAFVRKLMKTMNPALVRLEAKAPVAKRPIAKHAPVRRVGVKAA